MSGDLLTQMKNNQDSSSLAEEPHHSRKWIIIEDSAPKAEWFIGFILHLFPNDKIHWFYLEANLFNEPEYVMDPDGGGTWKYYSRELPLDAGQVRKVEGHLHFYWCKTEKEFIHMFDRVNDHNGIVLLDIDLPILGGKESINEGILGDKIREFFACDTLDRDCESMVCVTSSAVHHAKVRRQICRDDDWVYQRIYTEGAGDWEFTGNTRARDCRDVVERSHNFWNRLYSKTAALAVFLSKMAEYDQTSFHNWDNSSEANLILFQSKGTWDNHLNMPVQIKFLSDFLDIGCEEFIFIFNLRDSKGHYWNNCAICECLKVMGTSDADNFSLLGIAFLTWAAYRRRFGKEGKGNQLFINAIKSVQEMEYQHHLPISRNNLIGPPQKTDTLHKTITAYFEMLPHLFCSKSQDEPGADLLREVDLDRTGFAVRFEKIFPERLFNSISREYKRKCLNFKDEGDLAEIKGGGDTARAILKFFPLNQFCDKLIMNKIPFLGNFFSLKIYAAGDYPENGIILKFGNAT